MKIGDGSEEYPVTCQVGVMRAVHIVMRERLVHVHVNVQTIEKDGRVLVAHQIPVLGGPGFLG